MRQNIVSAGIQAGSSLVIAALTIGIFRLLGPGQMAFLRQHYFVPFAIIASISPANQNYLRSVLFSNLSSEDKRLESRALAIVQTVSGAILLFGIILAINAAGAQVSYLNALALALALLMILGRTLVGGLYESAGRYSPSILLNNFSSTTPYIAALVMVASNEINAFFTFSIGLSLLTILLIALIGKRIQLPTFIPLHQLHLPFRFAFKRYLSLSLISIGSVIVYQGVEFCLYNYTRYGNIDIANYALAFSAGAVMRQVIIVAIQPLEQDKHYKGTIKIPRVGAAATPLVIEVILYSGFLAAVFVVPALLRYFFSDYESAASYVPPLVLGILGTAIQQVYSVRLIAEARTKFVSMSQLVLASTSILVTLIFQSQLLLLNLVWLLSSLVWLRGCVVIPTYAALVHKQQVSGWLILVRLGLSALLFSMLWW